jgi:hypothetical protein
LVRPKIEPYGTRRKVASKRRKNLERELTGSQSKKGRQTKQKRLQNYDKLLNEDQNN